MSGCNLPAGVRAGGHLPETMRILKKRLDENNLAPVFRIGRYPLPAGSPGRPREARAA